VGFWLGFVKASHVVTAAARKNVVTINSSIDDSLEELLLLFIVGGISLFFLSRLLISDLFNAIAWT